MQTDKRRVLTNANERRLIDYLVSVNNRSEDADFDPLAMGTQDTLCALNVGAGQWKECGHPAYAHTKLNGCALCDCGSSYGCFDQDRTSAMLVAVPRKEKKR